jgi:hypothetical protein
VEPQKKKKIILKIKDTFHVIFSVHYHNKSQD